MSESNWKKQPKRKTKPKEFTKNLTIDILDFFLSLPEAFVYSFNKKEFYRQLYGFYRENELSVKNISKWLYNFKQYGYVEVSGHKGQESIRFTNKARLALVDRLGGRAEVDGRYRLVSFDIPEIWRARRNNFRRAIKRLGFVQIQKSLWVTNRNLGDLVELAAKEYKVEEYVVYAVVESIDIMTRIKELFSDD